MARKETTVVVKGKGEGWQPLHREVKKTYDAMDPKAVNKGFKQLEHFIGQVTRQVRGLEKGFKDLNQSIRMDRSTQEVKKLREEIAKLKHKIDVDSAADVYNYLADKPGITDPNMGCVQSLHQSPLNRG